MPAVLTLPPGTPNVALARRDNLYWMRARAASAAAAANDTLQLNPVSSRAEVHPAPTTEARPMHEPAAIVEPATDSVPARAKKAPALPTAAGREQHALQGHLPPRGWCDVCVPAAAADDSHKRGQGADDEIQLDYLIMGVLHGSRACSRRGGNITDWVHRNPDLSHDSQEEHLVEGSSDLTCLMEIVITVLVLAHRGSDAVHAILGPKGEHPYMLMAASAVIDSWGVAECRLKSDQEPAIQKLVEELASQRKQAGHNTIAMAAPRRSHQSMGLVENANDQVAKQTRKLKLELETRLGQRLPPFHQIMPWLVRHGAWQIVRYAVRQATGKTAYEVLRGHPYRGEVALFGEEVWARAPGERTLKLEATVQWEKGALAWEDGQV